MGWENMHECGKPYLWFAKPGQRWRCTKKLDHGSGRVPCGRLWEVQAVQDGLAWREVLEDGTAVPDSVYAARLAALDEVDVTREAVESDLSRAWLLAAGEGSVLTTGDELAAIRWTLQELERRGLAKWTHH